MIDIELMGKNARIASRIMAQKTSEEKNAVILQLADNLLKKSEEILKANEIDIEGGKKAGLSDALIERLTLNEKRLAGMVDDLKNVASLPDPVGRVYEQKELPNGLTIHKQGVPLGVIAVIYESRPNVTIEVTGLTIKTGNTVILRGGSETINSNRAFVNVIRDTLKTAGFPVDAIQFIDDSDRALVTKMLKMHEYIDMLIPRGGEALHRFCRENSIIPVITGGIGICHLYVDETADVEAGLDVIQNAKVQRPSVCNALDTILVHRAIAAEYIPRVIDRLKKDGVTFRVHQNAMDFVSDQYQDVVKLAGKEDFDIEWLALILGIKVVESIDEAIEHIMTHGTFHSDGILTRDDNNAAKFIAEVDSSAVYVNASTRFTDGAQFGLGAEVAVSTQRLHARGPMGLPELTTYKWVINGNYHVRQ